MSGFIAVHCGAGTHNPSHYLKYNHLSRKACAKAVEHLRRGGSALEAVKIAISVLEDDPLTNCGYGSNLTIDGCVETDASIMDGKTLMFGACGAVTRVKNPIDLAYDLCRKQTDILPLGLIPPSILVGKGAIEHALKSKLKIVKPEDLISPKAYKQHKKYKKIISESEGSSITELLDTVGAVCVDNEGHVAAGCSSGGILLKRSGRIGQAAIYASGVWADSFDKTNENPIAVCTSGCGEHLIRTQLAQVIGENVRTSQCPTRGLSDVIDQKFLKSKFLKDVSPKLCGCLVLHLDKTTGDRCLLWAHTTETMSVGYMGCLDHKAKGLISELPSGVEVGVKVNVSGVFIKN